MMHGQRNIKTSYSSADHEVPIKTFRIDMYNDDIYEL